MTPATATGAARVGDHQHVRRQHSRIWPSSVAQLLTGSRGPDPNLRAAELRQVEGMHRLAELEQHVVGDVDDVADRADAGSLQPGLHPTG